MKRNIYFLLCLLAFTTFFTSCQKEITFDLSLPSIGRLQCSRAVLSGVYRQGLNMNPENSLSTKIRVSRRGTYHVESIGVENGVKFSADGVFEEDGLQDIVVYATGRPQYADTFTYRVVYNTDTCLIPIYFEPDRDIVNAVMTFQGQPNTCDILPEDIRGTYMVDMPMNSSNTVTIHANVSVPGVYFIQTPLINGIRFSAQGEVTTTGPTDIVLQAVGTPVNENNNGAPFYYPVTVGGNACSISMTFSPFVPALTSIDLDCANAVISGTYVQDEPTSPTVHFIKIPVIYTPSSVTGTYNISTDTVNGVVFSGSGILDPAQNDSILLVASGTPTNGNPDPYTYIYSFPNGTGQSTCNFIITVSGDYITANINGTFTSFNVDADAAVSANIGTITLEIAGRSNIVTQFPDFTMTLTLGSGASFTSGVYDVNTISQQGGDLNCVYNENNITTYGAQTVPGTLQPNPFTVEIFGTATRINGRFYGTIFQNSQLGQQPILINSGVFSLPLP
jgi:hypothetical protein